MKGVGAGAIIASIVVILILALVFLCIPGTPYFSYCPFKVSADRTLYKNDIITIESSKISNRNPYPGSSVTIELLIKNNGKESISGVEVNFFDMPGFEFIELYCEGIKASTQKCVFDEIDSLDIRNIVLTLKVPSDSYIREPSLSYYVKYDYSGYRKADIPIIDETRERPSGNFFQSEPSLGPVRVDFEIPSQLEETKDSQTIRYFWGVKDRPIEIKLKFSHVGRVSGVQFPIKINKGNVVLDLRDVKRARMETELKCDFDGETRLTSNKDIEIPGEETLVCHLVNDKDFTVEIWASVWASFSYTYEFMKTERFTVKEPLS